VARASRRCQSAASKQARSRRAATEMNVVAASGMRGAGVVPGSASPSHAMWFGACSAAKRRKMPRREKTRDFGGIFRFDQRPPRMCTHHTNERGHRLAPTCTSCIACLVRERGVSFRSVRNAPLPQRRLAIREYRVENLTRASGDEIGTYPRCGVEPLQAQHVARGVFGQ